MLQIGMAQLRTRNTDGILGTAAQAIGSALGTIALRTGMVKPDSGKTAKTSRLGKP